MLESLQSFLPGNGLADDDIETLLILGAAFLPSVLGLLLAVAALWLPDDGYVLSRPVADGRAPERAHKRAHDDDHDWRRAA